MGHSEDTVRVQLGNSEGTVRVHWGTVRVQFGYSEIRRDGGEGEEEEGRRIH